MLCCVSMSVCSPEQEKRGERRALIDPVGSGVCSPEQEKRGERRALIDPVGSGIDQIKENQGDNAGESDYVNAVEHLQWGEELLFSTSHLASMGALG
ncbi:hypothetical protein HGM15179_003689 [Zosterops borbonicus]|uniref:Uncharacterized protein n=1 Tax=Zosterops borbonicus TaxID=364589 RepID=A0A8K1GU20_9PASS|nr:hypothetical protein HGM15179_003689 [Zosterops borbonicus]